MSIHKEIGQSLLELIDLFIKRDTQAHEYGTDTKLHYSEIHMIVFIYENPKMHISQIAREQNITRGAVSQTVNRLEKKGFLTKKISEENQSIMELILTEKGIVAYNSHEADKSKFFDIIKSSLGRDNDDFTEKIVCDFLLNVREEMEKL